VAASDDDDAFWMDRALAEARRGLGFVEPNPPVGAVIVSGGAIVAAGFHAAYGSPHAEVMALAQAGARARDATLYVTLEPCCHWGKTPPCADALIGAGIARVVAALRDPFPKVDGAGFDRLRAAGIAVECGRGTEDAQRLMGPYLKRQATGRPYVIAKWAMTLDGKIAARTGVSRWISGEASRMLVHELRGKVDAIIVGINTALADDPELTARPPGPRTAVRVVLDSQAKLPLGSRLAKTARAVPVLVAVSGRAPIERRDALAASGCEVVEFAGQAVPIGDLLDELGGRGMTNVLVEGGGRVLGAFWDEGEVDAAEVYLAPLIGGGGHEFTPVRGEGVDRITQALRMQDVEVIERNGDILLRGTFPRPWRLMGLNSSA
jgi:diaminohydroxyphosphoribosylaminopyrimidine deaminase/5-amino-6-(5-phosphoribosylamino)uracil reductase